MAELRPRAARPAAARPLRRRACAALSSSWASWATWALALAGVAGLPAQAQPSGSAQVAEVKAAFLVNFIRYTDWPPETFDGDSGPHRVVVVDDDAVAVALEEIAARTEPIRGRGLEVVRRKAPELLGRRPAEELRRAHLVYFGRGVRDRLPHLLAELEGSDVLTVGDPPRFAENGGMIGLRPEGKRIVFDANPAAIRSTRVLVSARVLKLARLVGGDQESPS